MLIAPLTLTATRAATLPLTCAAGLALMARLDTSHGGAVVGWSLLGAAIALVAGTALLMTTARRSGRVLSLEIVARRQHYLQACAQGSVLLYWGWHWREVSDHPHDTRRVSRRQRSATWRELARSGFRGGFNTFQSLDDENLRAGRVPHSIAIDD